VLYISKTVDLIFVPMAPLQHPYALKKKTTNLALSLLLQAFFQSDLTEYISTRESYKSENSVTDNLS
jgi:hypothetical protein